MIFFDLLDVLIISIEIDEYFYHEMNDNDHDHHFVDDLDHNNPDLWEKQNYF